MPQCPVTNAWITWIQWPGAGLAFLPSPVAATAQHTYSSQREFEQYPFSFLAFSSVFFRRYRFRSNLKPEPCYFLERRISDSHEGRHNVFLGSPSPGPALCRRVR